MGILARCSIRSLQFLLYFRYEIFVCGNFHGNIFLILRPQNKFSIDLKMSSDGEQDEENPILARHRREKKELRGNFDIKREKYFK